MNRKTIAVATLGVVVLLLLAGGGGYWYWTTTPKYSLLQIKEAVAEHDVEKFEKHVDLDSVLNRLYDDVIAYSSEDGAGGSAAEQAGRAMGNKLAQAMKSSVVDSFRSTVLRYVETGTLKKDSGKAKISVADIGQKLGFDSGVPKFEVHKEGKIAVLTFHSHHDGIGEDLAVKAIMRDRGGYWQLSGFEEVPELMRHVDEVKSEQLRKANDPIYKQLATAFEPVAGHFAKKRSKERWSKKRFVEVGMKVKNVSGQDIESWSGKIVVKDQDENVYYQLDVAEGDAISGGDTSAYGRQIEINPFIDSEKALFELPEGQTTLSLDVERVTFDGGKVLEPFEDWDDLKASGALASVR